MQNKVSILFPPLKNISIIPTEARIYCPPTRFEGSPGGHIGEGDLLIYLVSGTLFLLIGENHYVLRAGQMALLPDGVRRGYTPAVSQYELYTFTVMIYTEGVSLFSFLNLCDGDYVITVGNDPVLLRAFERSSLRLARPDSIPYLHTSADALEIAARYCKERIVMRTGSVPFAEVIQRMNQADAPEPTLDILASIAHMHPTHFIRAFKKAHGDPPMKYYADLRCQRAMNLLERGSVAETARRIGFRDPHYFTKFFTNHVGVSPTAYQSFFRNIAP